MERAKIFLMRPLAAVILILWAFSPAQAQTRDLKAEMKEKVMASLRHMGLDPQQSPQLLQSAEKASALLDVSLEKSPQGASITIHTAHAPLYTTFLLDEGKKFVIDFQDTISLCPKSEYTLPSSTLVERVRTSLYKVSPQFISRVVVDLKEPIMPAIAQEEGRMTLSFPEADHLEPQASQPQEGVEEKIFVDLGHSKVLTSPVPIIRVSIADKKTADIMVLTPQETLVTGKAAGVTSLILWDQRERVKTYEVVVRRDPAILLEQIKALAPEDDVEVKFTDEHVVLSGEVTKAATAKELENLAKAYAPNVVNLLKFRYPESPQIMLKVKFAEVFRRGLKELGINFIYKDKNLGEWDLTGASFAGKVNQPTIPFSLSDSVTGFLSLADDSHSFDLLLRTLEEKGDLETLAEPTLIAVSGQEASFLAGGEFPVPVVRGVGQADLGTVTIEWKEFGIRLKFIPTLLDSEKISLKVTPEVSSLDFENALLLSGFRVPSVKTRRVETSVEMPRDSSLVIGGLLSHETAKDLSKTPYLGDIPILGHFFKDERFRKEETELLVVITPQLAKTLAASEVPILPKLKEEGGEK